MKYLITTMLMAFCLFSAGQVLYPSDYTEDYYYILRQKNTDQIAAPITFFPTTIYGMSNDSTLSWDLWDGRVKTNFKKGNGKIAWNLLNPQLNYSFNTTYPRGFNDGPAWKGKGSNVDVSGGVYGNIGKFHITVAPVFTYAENRDFFIPAQDFRGRRIDKSEYSFPFEGAIDWVVRYGDKAYYNFHPGQSEVRFITKNFTVGLSTANASVGSARYNPIILSKNAGGFPRLDIGTFRPAKTKIGEVEYRLLWGAFGESAYFDQDSNNDRRFFTGFSLGYRPNFVEGLNIGINRYMYTQWGKGDISFSNLFAAFTTNSPAVGVANDEYDQMVSITIDWHFPELGFQAYLEYARNDFPTSFFEFMEQPDRSRARTIGMIKDIDLKNGDLLQIIYESTVLGANQVQLITPGGNPTYYVHSVVDNGYANNGQIIGAGIGPGSQSDIFKIHWYKPSGRYGLHFSRIRLDDDYFVNEYAGVQLFEPYPTDYEVTVGLDWVKFIGDFSIHPEILYSHRRNFLYQDDEEIDNVYFSLKTTYLLR